MSDNCQLVVFSNKAYNAIIRESFSKDPVETGGILLGHVLDNGVWIVMEVLPPGINSIFQYAYFEYDTEFVNYLAHSVANQYKLSLDLLGLWHRHPGSMDVFSSTDDGTNTTFAYQNPAGVISGLVNIDPKFRLTMYHLDHPTHRFVGRPAYDVVSVEVGDDIIPEEYFELRYFDGEGSDLHPTVASRVRDRQLRRDFRKNETNTIDETENQADENPQSHTTEDKEEGLDIQGIINRGLPPLDESQNNSPKFVNDFFTFWRDSKKRYIFFAVCALLAIICTVKAFYVFSSWVSNKFEKDNSEVTVPSLSMDRIVITVGEKSKQIVFSGVNTEDVLWKSENTKIATIKSGVITGVSEGKTTIIAELNGKKIGHYLAEVVRKKTKETADVKIDMSKTDNNKSCQIVINNDYSLPLITTGKPTVTFKSSNDTIAPVDNNGKVTGKKEGIAIITILCNGVEKDKFTIKVIQKK